MILRRTVVLALALAVSVPEAACAWASGGHSGGTSGGNANGGGNYGGNANADSRAPITRGLPPGTPTPDDAALILRAVKLGYAKPLSTILSAVRKRYQGKVVRIRLRGEPNNLLYQIRVLGPDNTLTDVLVNARTAAILTDDES